VSKNAVRVQQKISMMRNVFFGGLSNPTQGDHGMKQIGKTPERFCLALIRMPAGTATPLKLVL